MKNEFEDGIWLKVLKKPSLENGVLIQGLPGMGMVGKMVVAFLIEELQTEEIARLYSSYFPSVTFLSEGGIGRLARCELYSSTDPKFLLFIGDVQPNSAGMIQVLLKVINFAKSLGVKNTISIGGLRSENGPDVVGFVFDEYYQKNDLEKCGIAFLNKGQVTGACGTMVALSHEHGLRSFGLLGKIFMDQISVDFVAAKNVLKVLQNIYDFKIDESELEKMIEDAQEQQMQLDELLSQMEGREKIDRSKDTQRFYI